MEQELLRQFWLDALQKYLDNGVSYGPYFRMISHEIWALSQDHNYFLTNVSDNGNGPATVGNSKWFNRGDLKYEMEKIREPNFVVGQNGQGVELDSWSERRAGRFANFQMSTDVAEMLLDQDTEIVPMVFEHCVPLTVLQKHLRDTWNRGDGIEMIEQTFDAFFRVALITAAENQRLHDNGLERQMPGGADLVDCDGPLDRYGFEDVEIDLVQVRYEPLDEAIIWRLV